VVATGRAALTEAVERCWRDLLEVRDSCRAQGMGIIGARLQRVCTELDDVRAVLEQRAPEATGAVAVAAELVNRATMYAGPEADELATHVRAGGDNGDPGFVERAATARIARGFVMGYSACLDDSKSATVIHRQRRRVK
jgi:hypothetical protein